MPMANPGKSIVPAIKHIPGNCSTYSGSCLIAGIITGTGQIFTPIRAQCFFMGQIPH